VQIFVIWVPWRRRPGAETCRNLVGFLVVLCAFVGHCNYWSVDGFPSLGPGFIAWWYGVRWLVDKIVLECCRDQLTCRLECCRDQLTCRLNSQTMYTAAVGTAWSLLGLLRKHQVASYIFQMCCIIYITFLWRLKVISLPCSIIIYRISCPPSFQINWKLLRCVWQLFF
jgi:hypothetical protein